MTTLVTTDVVDGTTIDAADLNNNLTAIKNVVNGNIDNSNISAGAGIAISKLAGYPANAAKVLAGDGTWITAVTGPTWTYGASPPGSPTTGDIWIYRDADPDSAYTWAFRYNSANTTYDWEFIGGSPYHAEVTAASTHASTSYGDWAAGSTTLTIPRAGVYIVEFEVTVSYGSGNGWSRQALSTNGGAPVQTRGLLHIPDGALSVGMAKQKITFAASDTVRLQEKSEFGNTITAEYRYIGVTPVRVS